jgi:Protein of unknown function (DUF2800)
MSDEKKHAILGPSKADQWMTCLGSTEASLGIPSTTSSYAEEGTDHHEVAAVCLEEGYDAKDLIGRPMPSGAPLTEENAAFVQIYLDFVRAHKDDGHLLVEEEVPLTHLTGEPEAIGTSDAVILRTDRELFVADLKFGRGVEVSPERNRQAMLYALGVVEKHQVQEEYDTIRIGISQPRNGGNSDWVISMKDLLAFGEEVKETAKKVLTVVNGEMHFNRDLPRTPSEKACRFCKAKGSCEALKNQVVSAMFEGFDALDQADVTDGPITSPSSLIKASTTANLSPADRLGKFMSIADLAELWIKGVRGAAEVELLAGRPVTGFKLVQGKKGNRKWTDEEAVEAQMKSFRLKKDEMYNFSIISPADAEKLLAKKSPKRWDVLSGMYSQSDGAIHVAPASDKRKEYVPEKPETGFEPVQDVPEDGSDLI